MQNGRERWQRLVGGKRDPRLPDSHPFVSTYSSIELFNIENMIRTDSIGKYYYFSHISDFV
jgi:hypothetical protein